MKKCTIILRADDAGGSIAANNAIRKGVLSGVIKNVSIMAVGVHVDDAYQKLAQLDACFGLHFALNAEWDDIKWKPLSSRVPLLTDASGYFLPNPKDFIGLNIDIKDVIAELEAQYQYLIAKGFKISYVDSHMFPELTIPHLSDALTEWCEQKGLLCHLDYYGIPDVDLNNLKIRKLYAALDDGGQYFYVFHPAEYGDETLRFTNATTPPEKIAKERQKEANLVSHKLTRRLLKLMGISIIRYDEARPLKRLDLTKFSRSRP